MTTATQTAPNVTDDPWAQADTATYDPSFSVFGQVDIAITYVVLQKGVGKVPFDPGTHDPKDRVIAIDITVFPVIAGRSPTKRNMLSESREWAAIVNPSIKAFGPQWNAQLLKDRFVEAQMVASGRKRLDRETRQPVIDPATGKAEEWTTFKFVRVFANEDECVAAAMARFGPNGRAGGADRPLPEDAPAPAAAPEANDHERATAAKFLEPLWKSCNGDAAKFGELLKANPLTSRYFDLSSPEVNAVLTAALPF